MVLHKMKHTDMCDTHTRTHTHTHYHITRGLQSVAFLMKGGVSA
jgi:hypothetical protein